MVFDNPAEMAAKLDDPSLEITKDSVLVLRNAGPIGAPGIRNGAICRCPSGFWSKG